MTHDTTIIVPADLHDYCARLFEKYGIDVMVETHDHAYIACREKRLSLPAKAGEILNLWVQSAAQSRNHEICIDFWVLHPMILELRHENGDVVILTEKERDILCVLAEHQAGLSRSDLLTLVWGYNHAVETHTLETHVYRLRQKIEADPSVPTILVTIEDGYRLVKVYE